MAHLSEKEEILKLMRRYLRGKPVEDLSILVGALPLAMQLAENTLFDGQAKYQLVMDVMEILAQEFLPEVYNKDLWKVFDASLEAILTGIVTISKTYGCFGCTRKKPTTTKTNNLISILKKQPDSPASLS